MLYIPAAVTSAPAPGPIIVRGFALYLKHIDIESINMS